ncbi:hypothetical protein NQ315_012277 [Exocentrus adspersus]|uniref:Ig-like domain-containing protein n=1 Tax=Exocentrus adspersus TaxID=1586481 RepID=A0AAV8VEZ4_9CUCU|nr:hypothetical protein NQ315_012277 [Exocentrus adspersus]
MNEFVDAPRCRKGYEVMRVGSLPYETLVVQCHVDAIPNVTRFSWTYNTSKGVLPVQGAKMHNQGSISILHFTPSTDDVDSLSCWAANDVGRQQTPCLFYILPAAFMMATRKCITKSCKFSQTGAYIQHKKIVQDGRPERGHKELKGWEEQSMEVKGLTVAIVIVQKRLFWTEISPNINVKNTEVKKPYKKPKIRVLPSTYLANEKWQL